MRLSKTGFRAVYHNFIVIPILPQISEVLKGFPGAETANGVLGYGYYDREEGLSLEVLAAAVIDGASASFADTTSEVRALIRMEDVQDEEFMIMKDEDGKLLDRYSNKIELLNSFYPGDEIEKSRGLVLMDECRNPVYIDDVKVLILKKGMAPEYVWVRVTGLGAYYVKGELLTDPYQNYGYHVGDEIGFFMQELKDKKVICVTDLNPGVKITRADLADGKMLEKAISLAKAEKNEGTLFELIQLLRDSFVFIPCEKKEEEEEEPTPQSRLLNFGKRKAEIQKEKDAEPIKPLYLPKNGVDFLPVFSSGEMIGDFFQNANLARKPLVEAIQIVREAKAAGIVLNPFTEPFIIDSELMGVVEKMKSRITE